MSEKSQLVVFSVELFKISSECKTCVQHKDFVLTAGEQWIRRSAILDPLPF